MLVAVIGGKLQGLEAAYLAGKAGYRVLLIDKKPEIPARNFCDQFCCIDACRSDELAEALKPADLVLPALENRFALETIVETANRLKKPLAFDLAAYDLASSKSISDKLFFKLEVPAPRSWPDCKFPMIVKPSASSGSEGVLLLENKAALKAFLNQDGSLPDNLIVQEYLAGPSYSIEILGYRGSYLALPVTGLKMDQNHDCKRVLAPTGLSPSYLKQFARIAEKIARKIDLNGIMDVEVILHNNELKVLEIDARLPSQTPTAVYHSTGINMLELLAETFLNKKLPAAGIAQKNRAAIFEHIQVNGRKLEVSGEHVISTAGPLTYYENFFGADEVLTDYRSGKDSWVATIITTGSNRREASAKRKLVFEQFKKEFNLECCLDPEPVAPRKGFDHDQASF